jgi:putative endonuclease
MTPQRAERGPAHRDSSGNHVAMDSGLACGAPERRRWAACQNPSGDRTLMSSRRVPRMIFHVYMLASRRHGTLYIGVTNDLGRRVGEHKQKLLPGFTSRYDVDRLVWYEAYDRILDAIAREKSLKKWHRDWKIRLIEADNPNWLDLYPFLNQ